MEQKIKLKLLFQHSRLVDNKRIPTYFRFLSCFYSENSSKSRNKSQSHPLVIVLSKSWSSYPFCQYCFYYFIIISLYLVKEFLICERQTWCRIHNWHMRVGSIVQRGSAESSMDGGSIALCFAVFIILGVSVVHHAIQISSPGNVHAGLGGRDKLFLSVDISLRIRLFFFSQPPFLCRWHFSCPSSVFSLTAWWWNCRKRKRAGRDKRAEHAGQFATKWKNLDANGLNCKNICSCAWLTVNKPKQLS